MLNFCTLFDSNYLSRGIAMYNSLLRVTNNFHLYIFAFDDLSYDILIDLKLSHATIISLTDFEDQELLSVKQTRSAGEYCWTATPSTILYVIQKYNTASCTYLDADLLFYADPETLIKEMGDKTVLISEHRYSVNYNKAILSGKYCVQFMCFKNTPSGLETLNWWRNACLDWCYARHEDGKFGDQKYLDNWLEKYPHVHELQHLGGGLAPWNIQQYSFTKNNNQLIGLDAASGNQFKAVFYHFHQLKLLGNTSVDLCRYQLSKQVIKYFYKPYIKELLQLNKQFQSNYPGMKNKGIQKIQFTWKSPLVWLKRKYRKEYHIYELKEFN